MGETSQFLLVETVYNLIGRSGYGEMDEMESSRDGMYQVNSNRTSTMNRKASAVETVSEQSFHKKDEAAEVNRNITTL